MSRTPTSAFVEAHDDPQARGELQRELVQRYPNVSVIDVRDILASIRDVVDNVTLGVTVVGAVTLAGGVLILVGAVAMTKFQRLYEAAIYRTLGASTRTLAAMTAIEYGVLGTLAGSARRGGSVRPVLGAGASTCSTSSGALRPVCSWRGSLLTALLVSGRRSGIERRRARAEAAARR